MEFMNALTEIAASVSLVVTSGQIASAAVFALYVVLLTIIFTMVIQIVRTVAYRRRQKKAFEKWKVEYEKRMQAQREERRREEQRWHGVLPKQRVR